MKSLTAQPPPAAGPGRQPIWPAVLVLILLHGAALFADFLAPLSPSAQNREWSLVPPTWSPLDSPGEPPRLALLGTDRYGRDQLSRLLYGARISLGAGLLAGLLAVGVGLILGLVAGFYGGWVDAVLMRAVDLFLALPWFYLLLAVRAFLPLDLGPHATVGVLVLLLGGLGWAQPARLIRGVTLSAKERDYLLAAQGFGASDFHLLRHHLLPEALGVALTQLLLRIPRFVLAEATLSFLGLGVAEPTPSWGNMLSALASIPMLLNATWLAFPAFMLMVTILSYHRLATAWQGQMRG